MQINPANNPWLSSIPRERFAHLPTPLEPLVHLTEDLGGPRIWIKRDDCTGLAFGGNKARKLEYLVGHALSRGSNVIITSGAWQSNHVRLTAAVAAKFGMRCHVVLSPPNPESSEIGLDDQCGNLLLVKLLNAETHYVPDDGVATDDCVRELSEREMADGYTPYVVPIGGSNAIGAAGYIGCANEIVVQASEQDFAPTHLVLATGSGGTHAGLLAGVAQAAIRTDVIGISVSESAEVKKSKIRVVLDELDQCMGRDGSLISAEKIHVKDSYVGRGYALAGEDVLSVIRLVARREGILLDPVYTGKAMVGLIDLIRAGNFKSSDNVVFLHSGGTPAIFNYGSAFG